jgi:hypothetical protein
MSAASMAETVSSAQAPAVASRFFMDCPVLEWDRAVGTQA